MQRSTTKDIGSSDVSTAETTIGIAMALISIVISASISSTIVSLVAIR
jgi:hypothetical protein